MGGLIAIRLQGIDSLLAWGLIIAGLLALVPFGRLEAAQAEPLVDVRLLGQPTQWPIQFTPFLFGMSVLGAKIPLSTFARTDPEVGIGFGAYAGFVSTLIGLSFVSLFVCALTLPLLALLTGPLDALLIVRLFLALGYPLFL